MGRSWARLGGENSRSKGFWGRRQANRCFRRCRGEGFCAGGMVARQTAPGCTRCVRTEKGSARTKRARAEAPRTGVYVISAWNVRRTGQTGCNRAQGSFFADVDSRLHRRNLQYPAKWTGYSPEHDKTWYPAENFENPSIAIELFHSRYPGNISTKYQFIPYAPCSSEGIWRQK